MTDLRLGFIGYGGHARANLYPALAALGIPLAAIATRDATTAAIAAQREGAGSSYGDHLAMLRDAGLDGVFVSVGSDDQAAVVADCLEAGVHVFAEKPVGLTEPEAQTIADLAEARGRIVSVGFMKRYAPAYRRLESLMASDLGRLTSFNVFFGFNPWTTSLRDDSFLQLAGVHVVNLVQGLFGEFDEVSGYSTSQGSDISLAYALRSREGVAGTLTFVGSPAWNSEREHLQVSGTLGRATVDEVTRLEYRPMQSAPDQPWREQAERVESYLPTLTPASGAEQHLFTRGFAGELAAFVDAITSGTAVPTSALDNVSTMKLCDRLIAAL